MFRIESYITPIILSHIDKYVKDFRPKDAQVSLWGGEVAFQNLDLRLDVLEEELQLPFSFVSGHIHELTVLVPWTKIASEPIQITINTIEFVLKLKSGDEQRPATSTSHARKKSSAEMAAQAAVAPGYMASLINKIANNVSLKLHNIILKYVEEDIVVSMNIQLLSFDSADDNWEPAFIDINPVKVLIKKVINISDLTICLDKRNSLGIIEVCQEPMLYRCSLQIRMLRRYNLQSAHATSLLRMDIFTDSIGLNVTSQQYPMVMRLLVLANTLRQGSQITLNNQNSTENAAQSGGEDDPVPDDSSMISWAWNMLPTLFPADTTEDETVARKLGHIMHTGVYVKEMQITFKSQELVNDHISSGTKKLKYHPMMKICLNGLYSNTITLGRRWFNVSGGCSFFGVYPLGTCVCGKSHDTKTFLTSADILCDHQAYLNDSLWDSRCPENCGTFRSYDRLWESHELKTTMEELLLRTPAMAFDMCHSVDIPDDHGTMSNLSTNLEYSNLSETHLARASIGEFHLRYNSSVPHIVETMIEFSKRYNYAPYAPDPSPINRSQLPLPTEDEIEVLMNEVPVRNFHFSIHRPVIEIHPGQHDTRTRLPFFLIELEDVQMRMTDAYYPNRLLSTTCMIPEPPAKLLDACHIKYSANFAKLTISTCFGRDQQNCHLKITNAELTHKKLQYPDLFQKCREPKMVTGLIVECFGIFTSHPQLMLIQSMFESIVNRYPVNEAIFETSIVADCRDQNYPIVDITIDRTTFNVTHVHQLIGVVGSITNIQGLVYVPNSIAQVGYIESHKQKSIFLANNNSFQDLLAIFSQMPEILADGLKSKSNPPILNLSIGHLQVNLDPLLVQFFDYKLRHRRAIFIGPFDSTSTESKSISVTTRSPIRSTKNIELLSHSSKTSKEPSNEHIVNETVNRSSLIQIFPEPPEPPLDKPFGFTHLYSLAKRTMVHVDIKQWSIYIPDRSIRMDHSGSKLKEIIDNMPHANVTVFRLPTVNIRSSHELGGLQDAHQVRPIPVQMGKTIWTPKKDGFPWTIELADLNAAMLSGGEESQFLASARTSVTVMVSMRTSTESNNGEKMKSQEPAFVIHMDSSPVVVSFSDSQIIHLRRSMDVVRLMLSISYTLPLHTLSHRRIKERAKSPFSNKNDIKEFLGTTVTLTDQTTSDGSATTTQDIDMESIQTNHIHPTTKPLLSIWMQWTLAKITVQLFASDTVTGMQHRFTLELEDAITSYDQQMVYTKMKTKLGTMSGVCHTKMTSASNMWVKNDVLGIIARNTMNDSQEETFFELTVTNALTKNVHGKWFTWKNKKKTNSQLISTITEVMATIQSVDVKLGVEALNAFVPLINAVSSNPEANPKADVDTPSRKLTSVADLPLVFFKSHGIRVFLPLPNKALPDCNVLCIKITKIAISPNAENPLIRKPVRGDIYSKAAELGILNTPGSRVEDRQYEILFSSISMSSGKWEQIRELLDPSEGTVKDAHRKNPAFDWNNLTMKPTAEVKAIFERFNLSIVYAPCITLDTIVVCGQCVEVNCLTDLMVEMKSVDLRLLLQLATIIQTPSGRSSPIVKSSSTVSVRSATPKRQPSVAGLTPAVRDNYPFTDSGIESMQAQKRSSIISYRDSNSVSENLTYLLTEEPSNVTYPYDMSFVGGIFHLKLYHIIPTHETSDDAESVRRLPLISLTLFQPNVLISQSSIEKTSQISLFNAVLKLGSPSPSKDALNEFGDVIFTTHPGATNQFGIHPPLFCFKEHILASNEKHVDISARRPIVVQFNHETLEKCMNIYKFVDYPISSGDKTAVDPVPVEKISNKIKSLKKSFFAADRLDVIVGYIDIRCACPTERYSIRLGVAKFESHLVFTDRPQRLRFDGSLKSLMLWAGDGVVLHPLTLDVTGKFTKEQWKKLPLTVVSLRSGCVDVCIGPTNLRNVNRAQASLTKSMEKFANDLLAFVPTEKDASEGHNHDPELLRIPIPAVVKDTTHGQTSEEDGEFYQDDLRAGAFQFIDAVSSESLPLPYQIQIMSRDGGVICWCYPQPRSLHYAQIFPVPFHIHESSRHQTTCIKCELQYYSSVRRKFEPYCQFNLSEKDIQELQLPAQRITAKVWRILVHQSYVSINGQHFLVDADDESDDDDDEFFDDSALQQGYPKAKRSASADPDLMNLHPKALVGCMRVDSHFSPVMVPNVDVAIDVSHFGVSLRHDRETTDIPSSNVPSIFRQYAFHANNSKKEIQTFFKLNQRNFGAHVRVWDGNRLSVHAESGLSATVLDFGFLTTVPLLEECQMRFAVDLSESRTDVNVVTDTIRLRYGQMVGQTLTIGQQLWTEHDANAFVLATRYVLCNCTSSPIKIGQVQTDEALFLRPNEATFYSFRCTEANQKLRISMETIDWTAKPSIRFNNDERIQVVQVQEPNDYVTITTHKMGGSHLVATIRGQIEFRNMSRVPFHIQYRVNNSQNSVNTIPISAADLVLDGMAQMSLVTRCDEEISQIIKLRLLNEKVWSGEVPLHRTHRNTPWLVKVPTESEHKYVSFWVRVVRENLPGFEQCPTPPQRLLIIIWPLFILRSMLPQSASAMDMTTTSVYELKSFGTEDIELAIPGTHETEHEIVFDTQSYFRTRAKLSYKTIDRDVFFKYLDHTLSIDDINGALDKPLAVDWPSSMREEEIRCLRQTTKSDQMQFQTNIRPSRDLSSCLMAEVSPYCLIVNATSTNVLLKNSDDTSTVVHANHTAMASNITDPFTISFMLNHKMYPTCPIYMHSTRSRVLPSYELRVGNSGSSVVKVLSPSGLSKFHLTSSLDNGMRVMYLSPHYVFVNCSSIPLNVFAFCVLQRQPEPIRLPPNNSLDFTGNYMAGVQIKGTSPRGIGISTFFNLSEEPNDTNYNKLFNYFITLRIGDGDYSVPIQLNRTIQRKCFSVSSGPKHPHALSMSVLEHDGQMFISVYDDKVPVLRLENRTDRMMHVAQAESADASQPPTPQRTLNDEHFVWHTRIPPGATIFYTPPSVDAGFPEQMEQLVAILLACDVDTESLDRIEWSRPLQFGKTDVTYLDKPYVKVSVDTKPRSVSFIIDSINQDKEFNVKDIRTKLQRPSSIIDDIHPDRPAPLERDTDNTNPLTRSSLTPQTTLKLNTFIKGVQFILYSDSESRHSVKSEVMALYLDHMHLQYDQHTRTGLMRVANIQIDNQLHSHGDFDFPVLLCPQKLFRTNTDTAMLLPQPNDIDGHIASLFIEHSIPVLSVCLVFYENTFDPEEIRCTFQPIRAYIEDKYINVLLDVMLENLPANLVYGGDAVAPCREIVEVGQVLVPKQLTLQALDLAQPFQVRLVRIDPVSVLLSVHTCMRMYIALDHSPLDFAAFERSNIYSLPSRFGYHLGMHYVSGALFGAGWVVGSLEILGSPSGLARSVTTGLRDFVSMPVEGFWRGPWGLLVGITHGSASLIRNVTAGTVNSVTKMAASFARNLDRLSLDEEHLQRTEALRRQRPVGISDGISQGLTGLGISLLGAVGGLARHPLEAHNSMEVMTGLGRGLVGAVTKPISGAAELVALTGQGVLQTVGFNAMPTAREPAADRTGPLEPSAAKFARKLIPDAYADDPVLFTGLATILSSGCVCIALTQRLLILVDMKTDRVRQIYSLERIALRPNAADNSQLTICVDGTDSDPLAGEQEFQYDRVMAFVRESCEMLPKNIATTVDVQFTQHKSADVDESLHTNEAAAASEPSSTDAKASSVHNVTFYMDPHLAKYLVEYTELLQQNLAQQRG